MISKLARALPPNRYIEIRHDVGEVSAGMAAILMEERDQGDCVVARTLAEDDRPFEVLTCHMVGIEPSQFGHGLSADELEAIAYVRDMVKVNLLAGCQDAVSKRHTKMVDLFKGAAAKLLDGGFGC